MIQCSASLLVTGWGGGGEGWGEGVKEERGGGKAHTYCSPTWAQLQQGPATLVHEIWCGGWEEKKGIAGWGGPNSLL